jgi:large subunit ribosomal protein L22
MAGPKTNEREGTRAVLRYCGTSAYKVREVVDLVRGKPVSEAEDLLRSTQRGPAALVAKLLHSAASNAVNNDHMNFEELYVSACYVDEGPTAKRWRPRARGRATRIRKRSCHVTIIVSRLPENELARLQARRRAENLAMRARRVEATRRARAQAAEGASRRERRHPEAFAEAEAEQREEAAEAEAEQREEAQAEPAEGAPSEAEAAAEAPADDAGKAARAVPSEAGQDEQAEEDEEEGN